jgi:hypothetical protein
LCSSGLFPLLGQSGAVLPDHFHWDQKLLYLEASRQNNYVKFRPLATVTCDSRLVNLLNSFGDEVEIFAMESIEIIRVENTTFAT